MMLLAKKQFTDFVKTNGLFSSSDVILLAVSGGKDSVLMAHLFAQCGFKFAIAHCNFNLRGEESLRDQHFVEALAKELNVKLYFTHFDTLAFAKEQKVSIQMAARSLRYTFFEQIRTKENFVKIAVAQHQNDATETVMINLIRGTGIKGLHGIIIERDFIIRPMLCFTADDIQNLVSQNQLNYVEDSSNAATKYMRNKVRLEIIPKMKELNPSLEKTFQQNLNYFKELETLLNENVKNLVKEIVVVENNQVSISFENIRKLNPQHLLLFELLNPYGFNATQVENVINGLNNISGKQYFSKTHILTIDRDCILINLVTAKHLKELKILEDATDVLFNDISLKITNCKTTPTSFKGKKNILYANGKSLIYPLTLRYWKDGDVFKPFGMNGFKKLSDYFIQQKVPQQQKADIPILANGNGEIVWVCGFRSDDRYKVNSNTKKIIIFELNTKG
ncbi:tRNA lysidine(34) synthetase TilS [Pedobacter alpinus]|uniref:tRNA(Ile)-lysidine synthase n=1 Tax=Pedobacter alpinus TaxID=1590643 RepID=A0ABW5TMF6_9SPHI